MLTNFDCTAFYVADRSHLIETLSVLPEYLRNKASESGSVIDYRDWQIPLGRRFRALKLWFVIRSYGLAGLRAHVRNQIDLADHFASLVESSPDFEVVTDHPFGLVCFRHRGGDEVNQQIMDTANRSGEIYLTHTRVDDRLTLRLAIGSPRTERDDIEAAWRMIAAAASV
jgi:aromatic-L-amino-acid decarboxylase